MATSTYEVNLQLALATTANAEGDLETALEFLAEARRLAREGDRPAPKRRRARRSEPVESRTRGLPTSPLP